MNVQHAVGGALVIGALLTGCAASRRSVSESPRDSLAYERLAEEYESRLQTLMAAEDAAEAADDSTSAEGPTLPDLISEYVPRFRALAEAHPGEEDSGKALAWIAIHAFEPSDIESAVRPLVERFADQPYMKDVCNSLSHKPNRYAQDALRSIAEDSRSPDVRACARYCAARHGLMIAGLATDLRDDPDPAKRASIRASFPKDTVTWLDSIDVAQLRREAEDTLESLERQAGDVTYRDERIADLARSTLYELRDLAIGRTAPNIEGEDVDGLAFSLDQYRGRVIVLDFWGNW